MQLSNLPFVLDSTEVQKVGSLIGFSEINDKYWEYVAAQFDSLDVSAFKYGFHRITSYNVCYTKLLRVLLILPLVLLTFLNGTANN